MKNDNVITIRTFDDRSSYRRDKNYPNIVFLATVLRWSVIGTRVVDSSSFDTQEAIDHNDMSIDSTAAFLADHIESSEVPIFSKNSKLPLGSAEKKMVVDKLRSMDSGLIGGLIDDKGFSYYLDGYKLFQVVMRSSLPTLDDFEKGGVWYHLAWDAPAQWREIFEQSCSRAGIPDEVIELSKAESDGLISADATRAPGGGEQNAPIAQNEGRRGITKAEIIYAEWPMPNNAPSLESILNKIPKWVNEACIRVGQPGKGPSGSHLWNPAMLAVCLATLTPHKRWICNQVALTNLIRSQFPDYLDEWTKKQEML